MVNSNTMKPTEPLPMQQQLFHLVQRLGQPEMQQLLQPLVQPQTSAFYVYWEPSLGWVIVPIGPGLGMVDDVVSMLQGMSLNLEEQYQRIEREVMESKETESEQQQESSDAVFQDDDVERTLFATFSRGFPIKPAMLRDYFTREYGDIVEAVFPQKVKCKSKECPLYARVLLKSAVFVKLVLHGQEKLKLKLVGRDVWVRPYTRRNPNSKDSRHLDKGKPSHP